MTSRASSFANTSREPGLGLHVALAECQSPHRAQETTASREGSTGAESAGWARKATVSS
jgi:hypothetical protein